MARVYDLSTRCPSTGPLSRSDIDREVRTLFGAVPRRAEHRLALPDHHVPRPEVAARVLQAALQLGTGYLLVFGPPGCGKTTLATWIANEHDAQLMMRYHVFDPTLASELERRGRASALEFVRTMFDVLCDRFPSKALPYAPVEVTLPAAVSALRQELARLAEHQPRLVLVDGIDHIVRAKAIRGSLFDALPQPPPTNVIFVLFGQPDWEYPAWLLRMPRVTIPALTEIEPRSVVRSRMGWRLDSTGAAAVAASLHHRSRGNPLSLFYNLAVAETLGDAPEDVNASFQNATFFGDDPHEEYGRLFDDLNEILQAPHSSKSLRRELLALFGQAPERMACWRPSGCSTKRLGSRWQLMRSLSRNCRVLMQTIGCGGLKVRTKNYARARGEHSSLSRHDAARQAHSRCVAIKPGGVCDVLARTRCPSRIYLGCGTVANDSPSPNA